MFNVRSSRSAFTLVEVIIVISILGVIAGMAIPTLISIEREELAREPVTELHRLARTVRARAMAEQRPYQIAFMDDAFHAYRYFNPYGESEEIDNLETDIEMLERQREIIEASRERGIDMNAGREPTARERAAESVQEGIEYHEKYELPDGVDYSLRFWNETEWIDMRGVEFKRWVFQPSGMCEPMKIRVEADGSFFEVDFHPLTADIAREQSWVE